MNYELTPSFYNNDEFFNSYLGCTSYYKSLQNAFGKIISIKKPKKVLELGSALGTTSLTFAETFPDIMFVGADIRSDIVDKANTSAERYKNISFFTYDMCEIVKERRISEYDLIFMLYSFHHISDPPENKMSFLKNCFSNMKQGSMLLIGETFLPEEAQKLKGDPSINSLFNYRAREGYATTLWANLENLSDEGIHKAINAGKVSEKEESEAGKFVFDRQDEYLIKVSWLIDTAKNVGFHVLLAEPTNCIMEHVVALVKE